jgi:hypothetical protein
MCRASQLAADLEDVEQAGATTFGWVIIRDTSAHDCQLRGPIGIVGVTAAGVPDTITSTADVAGGLLLSADAAPVPQSALPPASEHVAFLVPGSPEFTTVGPNPGSDCTTDDDVVPAAFRLDIAGTGEVMVPNGQPGGTLWFSHLTVCQGDLDASGTIASLPS